MGAGVKKGWAKLDAGRCSRRAIIDLIVMMIISVKASGAADGNTLGSVSDNRECLAMSCLV